MSSMLVYSAQMEAVGGIESHVLELCLRFAQAGQQVTLMSSRFESSRGTEARLREAGVELIVNRGPWMTATPLRKWLWTLVALARLRRRRFAVVYTNGQGRNAAMLHGWSGAGADSFITTIPHATTRTLRGGRRAMARQ
jgi:hypothetical protein